MEEGNLEMELEVFDPRGENLVSPIISPSFRLDTLINKKIGMLINQKGGAVRFQPFIEKVLKEKVPSVEFETWSLGYTNWPGKEERIKEMATASDAIVALVGD